MTQLEEKLAAWHRCKFGPGPVNIERTIIKAQEELGELAKGFLKGDMDNMKEEAADVAIVLTHLVRGLGGSLANEMAKKAIVLENRLKKKLSG